ncbi:MAG: hypothetical protein V3R81_11185 [Gammaproteobacteria bacterium]
MTDTLECYRCGTSLAALTLPLRRLEQCPSCEVELHVCRMCVHYAPSRPKQCDEDDAQEITNKTTANFCDFYGPATGRLDPSLLSAHGRAGAQLDALFGTPGSTVADPESDTEADNALADVESLFKKD